MFHKTTLHTTAAICLLSLSANGVWAIDIINRKSTDKRASGDITEMTRSEVKITPKAGPTVTVPANDIVSIEFDSEPKELKTAEGLLLNNQYDKAREQYQAALSSASTDKPYLRKQIEFLRARAWALEGLAEPALTEKAIEELGRFLEANRDFYRYDEALVLQARLMSASNDPGRVETLFTQLSTSPFPESQLQADLIKADQLLKKGEYEKALEAFATLMQTAQGKDQLVSVNQLALKGRVDSLAGLKKPQEALELLQQGLATVDDRQPSVLADMYVQKGRLQELAGNVDDAILSYLMVDLVLGPQLAKRDANTQAEALYHLAKLWPLAGHPERATQAATSLQSNFAGSPWLTKLQEK